MRTIQQILNDISNIACKYACLHKKAMALCQKWSFNGFKRYHRIKSKEFYNIVLKLENKAYDFYGIELGSDNTTPLYEPANILSHFQLWISIVESDLKMIGNLNKEFYDVTGFEAPHVDCMKCIFLKEIEKNKRRLARFKQIGTEATALHDLHRQDDAIHEKMKEKEHDT